MAALAKEAEAMTAPRGASIDDWITERLTIVKAKLDRMMGEPGVLYDPDREWLKREIGYLEATQAAREAMKAVEWSRGRSTDYHPECPFCNGVEPEHRDGCKLAVALAMDPRRTT